MGEAPDTTVLLGSGNEIEIGERMRFAAFWVDPVGTQQRFSHKMRRLVQGTVKPNIYLRLPVIDGQELGMGVSHMQQMDIAEARNVVSRLRPGGHARKGQTRRQTKRQHLIKFPAIHRCLASALAARKGKYVSVYSARLLTGESGSNRNAITSLSCCSVRIPCAPKRGI